MTGAGAAGGPTPPDATQGPAPTAHARLVRGSAWLVATVAVTAISGSTYWLIAARLESADTVGEATALFTSVLFVNYLTNLGLPVAMARYVVDDRHPTLRLFGLAVLATSVSSTVGALLYLLVLRDDTRAPLDALGPGGVALFVVLTIGMAATLLVEVRLMALRRWGWVLGRVVLVAVGRFVVLAVLPTDDVSLWLFVGVAGPPALSGIVGLVVLRLTGHGPSRPLPLPATAGAATRLAGVNWGALLAAQGPQFALPVLVLANVPSDENAAFYIAFGITTVVFLLPHTIGQVLLVEGGRDGADLRSQVRVCLAITGALMAVIALAAWVGAGLVTVVYGTDYELASELLPVLVVAGLPWALTSTSLARARVQEDSLATMAITVSFAVATLVPAALLVPADGSRGATLSWLVGNIVAAAVALATLTRGSPRARSAPDPVALATP